MKGHLSYCPESGIFTWLNPTSKRVAKGDVAGRVNNAGHVGIGLFGERWQAHRLAIAFVEGSLGGDLEVDHKDQDKQNNSYENLRLATRQENSFNRGCPKHNSSGMKGVSFHQGSGKWEGYVHLNGKKHYLGLFENKAECEKAVSDRRYELHGEFSSK